MTKSKINKEFLLNLLQIPSPSGFEVKIQKYIKEYISKFAEIVRVDLHGNLIAGIKASNAIKIMVAGHCDQIGFMVRSITKEGFINVTAVGGIDVGVVPGSVCVIHSKKGPIKGVFGRKPIHLQGQEERQKMTLELSKCWIDIGAKNQSDCEKFVSIGDPVTFDLVPQELKNDLISAPGLDDKVGVFVAFEALRLLSTRKLNCAFYAVSTVQEEIGLRGARTSAYSVSPSVGFAVDVTFSSDNPGGDDTKTTKIALGKGPAIVVGPNANPKLNEILFKICESKKIPYQLDVVGGALGNDANAIQVTKEGVATASIGIPNRYMHSQVEVVSLNDLAYSVELLVEFCSQFKSLAQLEFA